MILIKAGTPRWQKIIFGLSWALLAVTILTFNGFRFYHLEAAPPGFHVDELSLGTCVQCLATEGTDALGNRHPLFGDCNYGSPAPPTAIYPEALWVKFFGFSIFALRAYSGVLVLIAITGLFFIARRLWGLPAGIFAVAIASQAPWAWAFSRIALDPIVALPCFVWGLYFLVRQRSWMDAVGSGLLFSAAMYSYPSVRLHLPLLLLFFGIVNYRRTSWTFRIWIVFIACLILPTIPLALKYLAHELSGRLGILIFSDTYAQMSGKSLSAWMLASTFGKNFLQHLSPAFLFQNGGPDPRYAMGFSGQLGWLDLLGLLGAGVAILQKKGERALIWIAGGVLLGFVPPALTWEMIPNGLRSMGAWPLGTLLSAWGLKMLFDRSRWFLLPVALAAIIFSGWFLPHYFQEYPRRAWGYFSVLDKDQARQARTEKDWLSFAVVHRGQNFHFEYYTMLYRGWSCSEARRIWEIFHKNIP